MSNDSNISMASAPHDRSVPAFKSWIMGLARAANPEAKDEMTDQEWDQAWRDFWQDAPAEDKLP